MQSDRFWSIVPAAGIGTRFGTSIPKQYLPLKDKLLIEHSLACLIDSAWIKQIVVAIAEDDTYWQATALAKHPKITTTVGGATRHLSVLNGLLALGTQAKTDDWVIVHDAARPCLHSDDLEQLIRRLHAHPVGGVLGFPVCDTMKQTVEGEMIISTINRNNLWHAYTPQMFRYGMLLNALQYAKLHAIAITDEASAIELLSEQPLMIKGRQDNIKVTEANDLLLAEFYLNRYRN